MYVLADIEWLTDVDGRRSMTQLAALKVDEGWNTTDSFDKLIRPRSRNLCNWSDIAFRGGTAESFKSADDIHSVLSGFRRWLDDEDVILWWHNDSERVFCRSVEKTLEVSDEHRMICLNEYVYRYLCVSEKQKGSPYKLAEVTGFKADKRRMHCSRYDVMVMQKLMLSMIFPQKLLDRPLDNQKNMALCEGTDLKYQYEYFSNTIHLCGCSELSQSGSPTKGYRKLDTAFSKGFRICRCCRADLISFLIDRNRTESESKKYTYIFAADSEVYHRYDCRIGLSAKNMLGTRRYDLVSAMGKKPCSVCRPTSEDKQKPKPLKENTMLSHEELNALQRHSEAVQERKGRLDTELTDRERSDIITLTQPGHSFWASRCSRSFHLRRCGVMKSASGIRGFARYEDAVRAGYTPCRRCCPTAEDDITLSIPIDNKERSGESVGDLELMCRKAGYTYSYSEPYLCVETSVGRWRIKTDAIPVRLEHVNLVMQPVTSPYHIQPRIFLSLSDTFRYIKKHDRYLKKKAEKKQK